MVQGSDALQRGPLIVVLTVVVIVLAAGPLEAAGPDSRAQAVCDSLCAAEDFVGAARTAQAWLSAVDARGDGESAAAAAALTGLLRALAARGGKPEPAEPAMAARLLAVVEAVHGSRSAPFAYALVLAGQIAERGGDFTGARGTYAQALALRREIQLPEDGDLATCLVALANVRTRLRDLDGVEELYRQALAISEAVDGPQSLAAARVLMNHAIFAKSKGDFPTAEDLFRRALATQIAAHGERQPDVARTYFNLANLQVEIGELETARTNYRRALAIREDLLGPRSPEVARTLNGLAILEKRAANLLLARDLAERAVAIQQEILPPLHPQTADALATLAAVQSELGDIPAARAALEKVLAVQEKAYGPEHPRVADLVQELAHLYLLDHDVPGALALQQRSRRIYESTGPGDDHLAAELINEAEILADLRHDREARTRAARAVAIREGLGEAARAGLGRALATHGRCLWQCGDLREAETALRRARTLVAESWGEDHPVCLFARYDLARVRRTQGATAEALDLALGVERGRRAATRLTVAGLAERLALQHAERLPNGLDLAATLVADGLVGGADIGRIWTEALRSRALVLDEMAQRLQTAVPTGGMVVDSLQAALASGTRELSELLVESWRGEAPADLAVRTEAIRARCESAEERLGRLRSRPRRAAAAETATLATVAAARRPGEALVAYLCYERQLRPARPDSTAPLSESAYLAFVLPAGSMVPAVVDLGPAASLDRLVRTWRDEASLGLSIPGRDGAAAADACRRAGAALRARVWDPVVPRLGQATRIAVVPDGPLHLINLAALPVAEDRYLVDEDTPIVVLGTERDLLDMRGTGRAAGELLAFGAPTVPPDLGPLRFAPLPASAQEVDEIAALWRRQARPIPLGDRAVVTRLGDDASEAAFKTLAPQFGTVHVATHGFVLTDGATSGSPGQRGVGGLRPADATVRDPFTGANPMLRAGLVLAADGADDGILTAAEIATLDLSAVDCVVLSACESGVGETHEGEGVFGLRRAFRLAGAHGLVVSLWPLADDQIRDWMLALYGAGLSLGRDPAAAVWQASRTRLAARRAAGLDTHPQTWAGFIACGD